MITELGGVAVQTDQRLPRSVRESGRGVLRIDGRRAAVEVRIVEFGPAIFRIGPTLYMHPETYERVGREVQG